MNDQEQTRHDAEQRFRDAMKQLVANVEWFNQFFYTIRQLYGIVVEMLLPTGFFPEGFTLKSTNFYFPRQNWAPTLPPYYVLMCGGEEFALQILAVFDPDLFSAQDHFDKEPSFVVVLHSQPSRYAYMDDYALRVIGNKGIENPQQADGEFEGSLNSKPPADFFSFQVPFDKFSTDENSREAVREYIVDPISEHLERR